MDAGGLRHGSCAGRPETRWLTGVQVGNTLALWQVDEAETRIMCQDYTMRELIRHFDVGFTALTNDIMWWLPVGSGIANVVHGLGIRLFFGGAHNYQSKAAYGQSPYGRHNNNEKLWRRGTGGEECARRGEM